MPDPAGPALLVWLENTAPAAAMREGLWLYPAVEVVHILGFVLLVGAASMFDPRLLGVARGLDLRTLARFLLPWSRTGLAVVVPSGLLLFSAHATEVIENPAFLLKLALILAAGLNAWRFHRSVVRGAVAWGGATPRTLCGRHLAAVVGGGDCLRAAAGLSVTHGPATARRAARQLKRRAVYGASGRAASACRAGRSILPLAFFGSGSMRRTRRGTM